MPAVKEANPTKEQQAVIDDLAKWIDPLVLAYAVVEEMVDYDVPVTLEKAKEVYLGFLDPLCENIDSTIKAKYF